MDDIIVNKNSCIKIDACGLQCPGPIMKLNKTVINAEYGDMIEITVTDFGFARDIEAWCKSTDNTLVNINYDGHKIIATIRKGSNEPKEEEKVVSNQKGQTILVFSNDLDKILTALIIANGARALGKDVVMFFTFWSLNALRKPNGKGKGKSLLDMMFGMMMPKGVDKLTLSKMNMGGMGTAMMKIVMKQKNVLSLNELMNQAMDSGIKIIACTMSMDVMGLKESELIDGIEYAGVGTYIAETDKANTNLFI